MKRHFVKSISLLASLLVVLSAVAGCGNTSSNESASTSTSVQSTQKQEEEKDLEKEHATIYVGTWDNKTYPEDNLVKQEIEKQTGKNLNLELEVVNVPGNDYHNKLNVLFASGQQVDAFVDGVNQMSLYLGKQGLVKDITDQVNQYGQNIKKLTEQMSWDVVTQKGKIYGIPNYAEASWAAWVVRKDILDKYNIPVPTTVEEVEKACEILKAKEPGMVPIVGNWWDMDTLIGPAFGKQQTTGSHAILDDEQRIVPYYLAKDNGLPFLQTYRKWVGKGWYDRDNLVTSGDTMNQMFLSGKAAFKMGAYGDVLSLGAELKKTNPSASVVAICELNNGGHWSWSGPSNTTLMITEQSKVADRLVQYVDWMAADQKNYDLAHYGIEGKHFAAKDGMLRGLPSGITDVTNLGYCGSQSGGTFSLGMTYLKMDRQLDNVSDEFMKAKKTSINTKWNTDPLIGKVTLDNSIETKYPKLKTFEEDNWKMKLLTGILPPTEESIKKIYDAYLAAGGDEVSKEYYKQYKAAGN